MALHLTATTDTLLFLAKTFFLPPKDLEALPTPGIASMNYTVSEDHLWVAFNRSLSSLCTLKETSNDVLGIMLLPSRQLEVQGGEQRPDLNDVDKVQFLCADNWDKEEGLRPYVNYCLTKILEASEEAETAEREGRTTELEMMNDLITHVYQKSWLKFCARITKSRQRGYRLGRMLRALQASSGPSNPSNLPDLVRAIFDVLNVINTNPPQSLNYVAIHQACTRVYKEVFENPRMKDWLSDLHLHGKVVAGACPPLRILQKIVKLRNGIENLRSLIRQPTMRPTFRGAQAARDEGNLITWVPTPNATDHKELSVDVRSNATGIKNTYETAINTLPVKERKKYAQRDVMWQRIQTGMRNVEGLKRDMDGNIDMRSGQWKIPAAKHKQHCEGKLLSYVIDNGLLGKVFPYIGCSKRCCEPCFTAISAVNDIILTTSTLRPDQCFAVAGTHRKVYSGFGISSIKDPRFNNITQTFNTLLCRDIGLVVQAGSDKGFGESDSAPEPETPVE
ncbi:hypothetical protein LXA43DRAFT_1097971 [Ganoderma leucocontextum]|nr:hypothetical protein LXA43DRAFT_1097971 [Ganoderma leucocontextum]